ncbi:hypothetical protein, partial [Enterobacter sp. SECR19-1250]|uniref:hypothetical protein n=1 Tax=Enterobacter sp. SECR19-1250 TaxID=2749084 RepID=UPI001C4A00E5
RGAKFEKPAFKAGFLLLCVLETCRVAASPYPALYYPPVQKEPASSFCQAVHMPYPALGHEPVS